jgi:hypothetical protein
MKKDTYRQVLTEKPIPDWEDYLIQESGLPGPRGNLELAQVVADLGDLPFFSHCLAYSSDIAPTNNPREFVAFCGVVGLGRLIADGDRSLLPRLRPYASDPRWRLREATAMALQRIGRQDIDFLLEIADDWSQGSWLEQRAAIAGLAEPDLLIKPEIIRKILELLDRVTNALQNALDRKAADFRVLRQGLGYAWSVVVAALPEEGTLHMERWFSCDDPDIHWVMRENLRKKRLEKAVPGWTANWREQLTCS